MRSWGTKLAAWDVATQGDSWGQTKEPASGDRDCRQCSSAILGWLSSVVQSIHPLFVGASVICSFLFCFKETHNLVCKTTYLNSFLFSNKLCDICSSFCRLSNCPFPDLWATGPRKIDQWILHMLAWLRAWVRYHHCMFFPFNVNKTSLILTS